MVDLKQTLSRFLSIPGVWQAILVGRDGLMIEGLTRDGKDDMEAVGAIMTTGLSTAEALGKEIARGSVIGVLMEYENGLVSVDPLGDFALIAPGDGQETREFKGQEYGVMLPPWERCSLAHFPPPAILLNCLERKIFALFSNKV